MKENEREKKYFFYILLFNPVFTRFKSFAVRKKEADNQL